MTNNKYYNRKVIAKYDYTLKGLSHTQLTKQRGFKGTKLGPAGFVHKLSREECKAIEQKMREEGKL